VEISAGEFLGEMPFLILFIFSSEISIPTTSYFPVFATAQAKGKPT